MSFTNYKKMELAAILGYRKLEISVRDNRLEFGLIDKEDRYLFIIGKQSEWSLVKLCEGLLTSTTLVNKIKTDENTPVERTLVVSTVHFESGMPTEIRIKLMDTIGCDLVFPFYFKDFKSIYLASYAHLS